MKNSVFCVFIIIDPAVAETIENEEPTIGLFTLRNAINNEYQYALIYAEDTIPELPKYATGFLAPNGIGEISEAADLTLGGGTVQSRQTSIALDNSNGLLGKLNAIGIGLYGQDVYIVEYSNNIANPLYCGIVDSLEYTEAVIRLSVIPNTGLRRRTNVMIDGFPVSIGRIDNGWLKRINNPQYINTELFFGHNESGDEIPDFRVIQHGQILMKNRYNEKTFQIRYVYKISTPFNAPGYSEWGYRLQDLTRSKFTDSRAGLPVLDACFYAQLKDGDTRGVPVSIGWPLGVGAGLTERDLDSLQILRGLASSRIDVLDYGSFRFSNTDEANTLVLVTDRPIPGIELSIDTGSSLPISIVRPSIYFQSDGWVNNEYSGGGNINMPDYVEASMRQSLSLPSGMRRLRYVKDGELHDINVGLNSDGTPIDSVEEHRLVLAYPPPFIDNYGDIHTSGLYNVLYVRRPGIFWGEIASADAKTVLSYNLAPLYFLGDLKNYSLIGLEATKGEFKGIRKSIGVVGVYARGIDTRGTSIFSTLTDGGVSLAINGFRGDNLYAVIQLSGHLNPNIPYKHTFFVADTDKITPADRDRSVRLRAISRGFYNSVNNTEASPPINFVEYGLSNRANYNSVYIGAFLSNYPGASVRWPLEYTGTQPKYDRGVYDSFLQDKIYYLSGSGTESDNNNYIVGRRSFSIDVSNAVGGMANIVLLFGPYNYIYDFNIAINRAAILYEDEVDISEGVISEISGRLYNGGWVSPYRLRGSGIGGTVRKQYNYTIQDPIDTIEHFLRLSNWSENIPYVLRDVVVKGYIEMGYYEFRNLPESERNAILYSIVGNDPEIGWTAVGYTGSTPFAYKYVGGGNWIEIPLPGDHKNVNHGKEYAIDRITLIDTRSFDDKSLNALKNLPISGQVLEEGKAYNDTIVDDICKSFYIIKKQRLLSNVEVGYGYYNTLNWIGNFAPLFESISSTESPVSDSELPIITYKESPLGIIRPPASKNIWCQPIIKYCYVHGIGYTKSMAVNGIVTNTQWNSGLTPGFNDIDGKKIWGYCRNLFLKYGNFSDMPTALQGHKWISDYETALWKITKLIKWQQKPRTQISVSWEIGRMWGVGTHLYISYKHVMNGDRLLCVCEGVKKTKYMDRVVCDLIILSEPFALDTDDDIDTIDESGDRDITIDERVSFALVDESDNPLLTDGDVEIWIDDIYDGDTIVDESGSRHIHI